MLHSEQDIKASYTGEAIAREYVGKRFENELQRLLHDRQVSAVNRLIQRERPRNILECAPGPGRVTREVDFGDRLVCLEYNEGMIQIGREASSPRVQWLRGDAFQLPFKTNFDFAYTFRFVRHFHHEDRARLYEQLYRALRPDGWLMIDAVNAQVSAPLRRAHPDDYPIYDKIYRDEDELRDELQAAGFQVVECQSVQRWFPLQYRAQVVLGPRSALLCRAAIRALEALRRGPALEWIVTCRRA